MFTPAPAKPATLPRALRVAAEGACGRRRAQPPRTACRHRGARRQPRRCVPHAGDRHPDGRHTAGRARALSARAGGHPHHDARVAVSAAHVERARSAALDRYRHRRRDPRARAHQAGRASRAVARAARSDLPATAAADRPLGDAASARRSREISRRAELGSRPSTAARGQVAPNEFARPPCTPSDEQRWPKRRSATNSSTHRRSVHYRPVTIVDAGQKKQLALTIEVPVEDMARLHHRRRHRRATRARRSGRRFIRGSSSSFARTARR